MKLIQYKMDASRPPVHLLDVHLRRNKLASAHAP